MTDFRAKTFGEVCDLWLEDTKDSVKSSSYLQYHIVVQKYIAPHLGHLPVTEVNAAKLREFLDHLLTENSYGGRPLSTTSVSGVRTIIKMILQFGAENQLMPYVQLRYRIASKNHEMGRCLPAQDAMRMEVLLSRCTSPRMYGILLCLDMGLRLGELCALQWKDIDLESGILSVSHTVKREEYTDDDGNLKCRWGIGLPKSSNSRRDIPVPEHILIKLRQMHTEIEDDNCYFLNGRKDRFVQPRSYQRTFHDFLAREGFRQINIHSLRHSFATRCIRQTDARTVSSLLGHSDPSITMRLYVHTSMETKREAIRGMEKTLLESV